MGNETAQQTYDLKNPGHISPSQQQAPRISEAIFNASAGKIPTLRTSLEVDLANESNNANVSQLDFSDPEKFDVSLKLQLRHIFERLQRGLEEAWRSPWGYDGVPDPAPDEEWARLFAEYVVFAGYSGVKWAYDGSQMSESEIPRYEMCFMARASDSNDPVFPISMACQHLSTLCLLSRGYTVADLCNLTIVDDVKDKSSSGIPIPTDVLAKLGSIKQIRGGVSGCAAGNNGGLPLFTTNKAKWITAGATVGPPGARTNQEQGDHRNFKSLIVTDGLSPGSIFGFNPQGPNPERNQDGSHIGSVLRVLALPPDGFRMQGIDTGPLGGGSGDTVTVDHNFQPTGSLNTLPGYLVGVGVLPKVPATAESLSRLRRTRPIGLARLVLFDEANRARFISPLMPLHYKDIGFPVSKLVWSLRDLPTGGLRGLWLVNSPLNAGTRALIDPAVRTGAIGDSFKAVGIDLDKTSHPSFSMDQHVIVNESASAVALFRYKSFIHAGAQVTTWVNRGGGEVSKTPPYIGRISAGTKPKMTVGLFLKTFPASNSCVWRNAASDQRESAADLLADMEYFGAGKPPEVLAEAPIIEEPAEANPSQQSAS